MELTFGMLAVWLFIFYVERSIVKADGVPFWRSSSRLLAPTCVPGRRPGFLQPFS